MKEINLASWDRYEHFNYFKDFKDPFFNICADVDVTDLKKLSINNNLSFFVLSIYNLLKTINSIDEFRYRIKGKKVVCYDKIRAGCTIFKQNKTFGFAYFTLHDDFEKFYIEAAKEIDKVKNETHIDPKLGEDDMVYASVLPWISFKSVEHAKNPIKNDSIPKIVFGKLTKEKNKTFMPVSVSAHHSLMDAYHVGLFFKLYEDLCKERIHQISYKPIPSL